MLRRPAETMRPEAPQAEREAVPQLVVREIRQMISDGRVRSGEKLPSQRMLSSTLNISRASLREALSILETTGLIRIEPGRGAIVCAEPASGVALAMPRLDQYSLEDVFQTRLLLETYATRLAAAQVTAAQTQRLRQVNEEMRAALRVQELDQAAQCDLQFHGVIIQAACNDVLTHIHGTLQKTMLASHLLPLGEPARRWEPIIEHENVLKALELHDPDSAAYYMRLHLIRTAGRSGLDEARCSSW